MVSGSVCQPNLAGMFCKEEELRIEKKYLSKMLPPGFRLNKVNGLAKVCRYGKGFKTDSLLIKILPNQENKIRLAFVVSKKIALKANQRNLIKRRLRESAKEMLKEIKNSNDIAVFSLPGLEKKNFDQIRDNLKRALAKAGVFNR